MVSPDLIWLSITLTKRVGHMAGPGKRKEEEKMNFGVMGPGVIAEKFAGACELCEGVTLLGVASRNRQRAEAFASRHGVERVYDNYEALLADPAIDAVYISVIHTGHYSLARRCIEAGKAVLCEKPLTCSSADTEELARYAAERGVLLMEAMWTLFLPPVKKAMEWLRSGAIGTAEYSTCNFSSFVERNPKSRLFDPAQAGGGLLDVGVYCGAFLLEMAGEEPTDVKALLRMGPTGVDEMGTALLRFPSGLLADCTFGLRADLDDNAYISGSKGKIILRHFWRCRRAELYDAKGNTLDVSEDKQENGFVYELEAFRDSFCKGETECPQMPLRKTIAVARWMEAIEKESAINR